MGASINIVHQIQFYIFNNKISLSLKTILPCPYRAAVLLLLPTQGCGALRLTLGCYATPLQGV
jgi:hypothetical protein